MVIGPYSFWTSRRDIREGKTDAVGLQDAQGRPGNGPADLSKTAGAEAVRPTLNPAKGQHRRGRDPSLRASTARRFGSNLGYPSAASAARGGQANSNVVLPGSLRVNSKAGRLGATRRLPRHAGKPSTGKSLQWIERLKRSPSPN